MKFRLTIHPAFDLDMQANIKKKFKTKEEMIAAKDSCADLLLFLQGELTVMKDYSNMFVQEVFEDGEWVEIEE